MNAKRKKSNYSLRNLVLGASQVLELAPFLSLIDPSNPLQKNQDLDLLRGDFSRVRVNMNVVSLNLLKHENSNRKKVNYFEMVPTPDENSTSIKVIGVGGGGGNAVEHMISTGVQGLEFITANTDAQALSRSAAHKTIQLGATGLGAGSKPDKGRDAAQSSEDDIRKAIDGAKMLFITAGIGGGTGTGAAPVIARVAREMGIFTVGVVTKPFEFEGGRRKSNAEAGLAELEANVDSLIVVLNEKLLEVLGDHITQDEAFSHANDVLKNAIGGIAEIINVPGHLNVDFEDVRTVMGEPGKAMIGTAMASGPDRARIAAEQAIACPLLEGVDLSSAKGVLVLITASKGSLKLIESKLAMNTIRAYASADAHVIYGAALDDSLGEDIRVTVLATGLSSHRVHRKNSSPEVLRTGTDDTPLDTQPDKNGMVVPSVWRTNRTQAAAKIDAFSSDGMDDLEIPAFLRKKAE
jgi:cell division protein FtsZ